MALHAWLPSIDDGPPMVDLSEALSSRPFPFIEVGHYVRGMGLARLAADVTDRLERIDHLLPECALPPDNPNWPLTLWLPFIVRWRRWAGSDSAAALLDLLVRVINKNDVDALPGSAEFVGDGVVGGDPAAGQLIAALVADLARIEAQALKWGRPSRLQRERTVACLRLLADVVQAWSSLSRPTTMIPVSLLLRGQIADHVTLAATTARLAGHVLRQVGEPYQSAVNLTMLPVSPLHDEQLQIRVSQLRRVLHHCASGAWPLNNVADCDIDALTTSLDRMGPLTWPVPDEAAAAGSAVLYGLPRLNNDSAAAVPDATTQSSSIVQPPGRQPAAWPSHAPLSKSTGLDAPIEAT